MDHERGVDQEATISALVDEVARLRAELAEERCMNTAIRQQAAESFGKLDFLVKAVRGLEAGLHTALTSLGLHGPDHGEEDLSEPVVNLRVVEERRLP